MADMSAVNLRAAMEADEQQQMQELESSPPIPSGQPFDNIPEPPSEPRPLGIWVHPQERGLREWYALTCQCGSYVVFPWLGFQTVTCPTCGSHLSSQGAVTAAVPDAGIQAKAQVDEKRLQEMFAAERLAGQAAKKFATKFAWLKHKGDTLEKLFFGKPYHYGNFKMYWNGKIILSPSSSFMIFPPMIVGPPLVVLYFLPGAPPIIFQVIMAVLLVAFTAITMAHLIEPGIQLKGAPCMPQKDVYETLNGHTIVQRWCRTCHCLRPARASHCAECDVCVDNFDHHCHITGTCVGKRNFVPFIVFVFGIAIADFLGLVAFVLVLTWWDHTAEFKSRRLWWTWWSVFALIWTLVTTKLMCNMSCVIAYMMTNSLTTRELLKGIWAVGRNPYDTGSKLRNALAFFTPSSSKIWGKTSEELERDSAA